MNTKNSEMRMSFTDISRAKKGTGHQLLCVYSVLRCQARSPVNSATDHFKFLCPQLFPTISRSLFVSVYRPRKDESLRLGCLSLELNLGHSSWSCMHAVSRLAVILITG